MIEECAGSVIGAERRGVGAAHPFARQSVDRRRMGETEAVAAEPIGPQRVDGDQQDVRTVPHGDRPRDAASASSARRRRHARATA